MNSHTPGSSSSAASPNMVNVQLGPNGERVVGTFMSSHATGASAQPDLFGGPGQYEQYEYIQGADGQMFARPK